MAKDVEGISNAGDYTENGVKAMMKRTLETEAVRRAPHAQKEILKETNKFNHNSNMRDFEETARAVDGLISRAYGGLIPPNTLPLQTSVIIPSLFMAIAERYVNKQGFTSPFAEVWNTGQAYGNDYIEYNTWSDMVINRDDPNQMSNTVAFQDFPNDWEFQAHRWDIRVLFPMTIPELELHRVSSSFNDLTNFVNGAMQQLLMRPELFKDKTTREVIAGAQRKGLLFGEAVPVGTDDDLKTLMEKISNQCDYLFSDQNNYTAWNAKNPTNQFPASHATTLANDEAGRQNQYKDAYVFIRHDLKNRLNWSQYGQAFNVPNSWHATNWKSFVGDIPQSTLSADDPLFEGDIVAFVAHRDWFKPLCWHLGIGSGSTETFQIPFAQKTQYGLSLNGMASHARFAQAYGFSDAATVPSTP